jgi:hypothetical protein
LVVGAVLESELFKLRLDTLYVPLKSLMFALFTFNQNFETSDFLSKLFHKVLVVFATLPQDFALPLLIP